MKSLFDDVSAECSKLTTQKYSTSFSFGIRVLKKPLRHSIYSIYGFVRFADEIVDSFEGYDKEALLQKFRKDTFEAIEQKISLNPILNSFQQVVNEYSIDHSLIDTFLKSMEMDLVKQDYTHEKYNQYILGSAEVVGLMCLYVFTDKNLELYENLKPFAMKLGSAFQKVNFLRDIHADYVGLGRTYFPDANMNSFDGDFKRKIEKEIELEFKDALKGIRKLPHSSRSGVYLVYIYYRSLLRKIRSVPAQQMMKQRIRVNNGEKFGLMVDSLLRGQMNLI